MHNASSHFVATSGTSNIFQFQAKHKAEAAQFQGQCKQASICIANLENYTYKIHTKQFMSRQTNVYLDTQTYAHTHTHT